MRAASDDMRNASFACTSFNATMTASLHPATPQVHAPSTGATLRDEDVSMTQAHLETIASAHTRYG
ncbi:hypothetical protein, partial [Escherichia coli]|uniref:hypothetical protein n=1 Tax=Escherichia coli TaxID=562 RepID=UPI001BDDC3F9